jgi:NAD(P)-dependent dehydrogenase (short-subunit alcohol dehydrogenase family)
MRAPEEPHSPESGQGSDRFSCPKKLQGGIVMSALVADAAAPDDAVRTIARAIDTWGRVDVLVNNPGAGAILPLADATWRQALVSDH